MPKLPPPPRSPQNSSGSCAASTLPELAVGGDQVDATQVVDGQAVLAHQVAEAAAEGQAADPGVADRCPPVVARPYACVARSSSPQSTPPAARAVRRAGSTRIAFISDRSIITPSSQTAYPATEWPPPRTDTSRPRSRAKLTASTRRRRRRSGRSAPGRRSIAPFQTRRASSYPSSPGRSSAPRKRS